MEGETKIEETGKRGILFSPEGVLMLTVAIFIDFAELFVNLYPGVGQMVSLVIDMFALTFFGSWLLFRRGVIRVLPKRTSARITKVRKWAKRIKWLRPLMIFLEFIPAVGALPCWTILVYFELKS